MKKLHMRMRALRENEATGELDEAELPPEEPAKPTVEELRAQILALQAQIAAQGAT